MGEEGACTALGGRRTRQLRGGHAWLRSRACTIELGVHIAGKGHERLSIRRAGGKPSPISGCYYVGGIHPSQSIMMNIHT